MKPGRAGARPRHVPPAPGAGGRTPTIGAPGALPDPRAKRRVADPPPHPEAPGVLPPGVVATLRRDRHPAAPAWRQRSGPVTGRALPGGGVVDIQARSAAPLPPISPRFAGTSAGTRPAASAPHRRCPRAAGKTGIGPVDRDAPPAGDCAPLASCAPRRLRPARSLRQVHPPPAPWKIRATCLPAPGCAPPATQALRARQSKSRRPLPVRPVHFAATGSFQCALSTCAVRMISRMRATRSGNFAARSSPSPGSAVTS